MAGITALRKIQFGYESTAGTPVACTTIWRGMGLLEDTRDIKHVDESIGIALPTTRNYTPKLGAKITLDPIEATFQQIAHLFQMGIKDVTPVQDGAGSDYISTYTFPTTAQLTPKTYTVEMGDNQLVQESDYVFCESFKISGNATEGVMMEGVLIGRDLADTTFSGGATVPVITAGDHIIFGGSNFYLDAVSGSFGGTEVVSTLLKFELDVTTGLKAKFTNLGKDFDFVYFDKGSFSASLKFTFEHNAIADAQRDLYESNTPRLVQLKFTGNAVGTPGTTYSNNTFIINCAGVYTAMPYGDVDGNATVEAEMQIGHDTTAGKGLEFIVVNELAALP